MAEAQPQASRTISDRLAAAFPDDLETPSTTPEAVSGSEEDPQPAEAPSETPATDSEDEEQLASEEETEEAPSEEEKPESESSEGISTLEELAEAFEVPVEDLTKHIQVKVGEKTLSLSDVISTVANIPESQRMAEDVEAVRAEYGQREQARLAEQQKTQEALHVMIEAGLRKLESGPSEEQMAKLKEEDRDAWLIAREEQREFRDFIGQSIDAAKKFQTEREAKQAEAFEAYCTDEGRKLIRRVPEWADEATARKDLDAIGKFLEKQYGFTTADIANMPDHRIALMARDAYSAHQKSAKKADVKESLKKKKLQLKGKPVPSQARRPASDPLRKKFESLRKRQRDTARRGDLSGNREVTAEILGGYMPSE